MNIIGSVLDDKNVITCNFCGSILQYSKSEVIINRGFDPIEKILTYDQVKCLNCNNNVDIRD